MTRELALNRLTEHIRLMSDEPLLEEDIEALKYAISVIKQEPCEKNTLDGLFKNIKKWEKEAEQEPCETSTDEPMTMVYPTIFCEDAISREAVIDAIDKWVKDKRVLVTFEASEVTPLFENIHELPSVQPTSNTQKDVEKHVESALKKRCEKAHEMIEDRLHCSCGIEWIITGRWNEYNYCPNCGAKMTEPQESEDEE